MSVAWDSLQRTMYSCSYEATESDYWTMPEQTTSLAPFSSVIHYDTYAAQQYNTSHSSHMELPVPQRQYQANIQRNHIRNIPPVEYFVNGRRGIKLTDALSHNFRGLAQAEDRLLDGFGVKVTYRLEWPGYPSFNKQKHALRATRAKESVTRAKLAVHVAEVVKDFIEEMSEVATSEMNWRVGPQYITLEDLYLLEIHQVAKASLQPVILYRPRTNWYSA